MKAFEFEFIIFFNMSQNTEKEQEAHQNEGANGASQRDLFFQDSLEKSQTDPNQFRQQKNLDLPRQYVEVPASNINKSEKFELKIPQQPQHQRDQKSDGRIPSPNEGGKVSNSSRSIRGKITDGSEAGHANAQNLANFHDMLLRHSRGSPINMSSSPQIQQNVLSPSRTIANNYKMFMGQNDMALSPVSRPNLNQNRSASNLNLSGVNKSPKNPQVNQIQNYNIQNTGRSASGNFSVYNDTMRNNNSQGRPGGTARNKSSSGNMPMVLHSQIGNTGSINLNDSISTVNQSLSNLYANQTPNQQLGSTNELLQVHDLKKEMRRKEQEHQKQTALLKQRVHLLEMQQKEYEQREVKMKQMHESMLKAVQEGEGNAAVKRTDTEGSPQLQYLNLKEEFEELQSSSQKEIRQLQEKIKDHEFQATNYLIQIEEKEIEGERKVQELQLDKRNLVNKIKKLENQLQQNSNLDAQNISMDHESKISELKDKLTKANDALQSENKKQKSINQQLQEQKTAQSQQIDHLQQQVFQKEKQLSTLQQKNENLEDTIKTYERQVDEMESQIENMGGLLAQKDEEIGGLRCQVESLHQQNQLSANSTDFTSHRPNESDNPQSLESQMQIQRLSDENEYLNEQIQSYLQKINQQQEDIKKYQNIEQISNSEVQEKDFQLKNQRQQFELEIRQMSDKNEASERVIEELRQQAQQLQQAIVNVKQQFEVQKTSHDNQMHAKDAFISQLQNQIMQESGMGVNSGRMDQHSPIRCQNTSTLMVSQDFQNLQQMQGALQGFNNQGQSLSQRNPQNLNGCGHGQLKNGVVNQSIELQNSAELQNVTLNLNISQYPSTSLNNIGAEGALAAEDLYDLPRQLQSQTNETQEASNIKIDMGQPDEGEADPNDKLVQIPNSELDLLLSCQKIIDAAQSMKCLECHKIFQTTDFYDHIIVQRECIIESERSEQNGDFDLGAAVEAERMIEANKHILHQQQEAQDNQISSQEKVSQTKEQMITQSQNLNHQNIQDLLHCSHPQNVSNLSMGGMNLEKLENSDFYHALNMPLQIKDTSLEKGYQTYQTNKTQQDKINNSNEQSSRQIAPMVSSPFNKDSAEIGQASGSKQQQYQFNQNNKTSLLGLGIKSKKSGNTNKNAAAGFGSRSGHTGLTGTVNSHILMSLSRSESSTSGCHDKSKLEHVETVQNTSREGMEESKQQHPTSNVNFDNDNDNIRNFALLGGNLLTEDNATERQTTARGQMNFDSRFQEQPSQADIVVEKVKPSQQAYNNMISCPSDDENMKEEEEKIDMSLQSPSQIIDEMNTKRSKIKDNDMLLEDVKTSERKPKEDGEDSDPHNLLSESLRNIVNNDPMASLIDTNILQTYQNEENEGQPSEEIKQNLEKLYDLDTSRFEEEYSMLSSNKKKMMLNQLNCEEKSPELEQEGPKKGQSQNTVHQSMAFQDISKFNMSLDHGQNALNKSNQSSSQQKPKVKVVGVDLTQAIRKNQVEQNPNKNTDMPRQRQMGVKSLSMSKFETSQEKAVSSKTRPPQASIDSFQNQDSMSNSLKPKFDLSKQIQEMQEMNQKKQQQPRNDKLQKFQEANQVQEESKQPKLATQNLGMQSNNKGKPRSQSKAGSFRKREIQIEIEDNNFYGEGDKGQQAENLDSVENLNMPLKIAGIENIDDLMNHKNVMESFRNYQNKILQQNNFTQPVSGVDINGQFQSVSSKNGTQNFDFGALKEHGPQPSSRRHAHGTNRYNKNGFMLVTSQSSDGGDLDENIRESDEIGQSQQIEKSGYAQTTSGQTNQLGQQNIVKSDIISPKNQNGPNLYQGAGEYELDQKTIEQHNLRQMSQKYSKRRQEIQKQISNNPDTGGLTDRRMDTSGFDIGAASEFGHSPLAQRMQMPQNQVKVMKDLKQARFAFNPINEEEKSQTNTMDPDHDFDEEENEDLCKDLIEMEQANDPSGGASGFQSHRHHLGEANKGFVPTLMANQEQRHFEKSYRENQQQQTAQTPQSAEQLEHLRNQILMIQNSSTNQNAQNVNLQTQLTEELLRNFEREKIISLTGHGIMSGDISLKNKTHSSNMVSSGQLFKQQQFSHNQNVKQVHKSPKTSTKNSDYIRKSMLMFSGKSNPSGKKLRSNQKESTFGKAIDLKEITEQNDLQIDDCPEFFDEDEFDEEMPVAIDNSQLQPVENNPVVKGADYKNAAPKRELLNYFVDRECNEIKNVTSKQKITRKDPLKNSLFHNHTQRTRGLVNLSALQAYNTNADNRQGPSLYSQRSNKLDSSRNTNNFQNYQTSGNKHHHNFDSQGQSQSSLLADLPNFLDNRHGSTSQLHKHMAQTSNLIIQRNKSKTKQQNMDQMSVNQSIGVINKPMMSYNNTSMGMHSSGSKQVMQPQFLNVTNTEMEMSQSSDVMMDKGSNSKDTVTMHQPPRSMRVFGADHSKSFKHMF